MASIFTIEDLIDLLIGPVDPCGSHGEDLDRLENLKKLCELNESITEKLCNIAGTVHAGRASMKSMAEYAESHLISEVDAINDSLNRAGD